MGFIPQLHRVRQVFNAEALHDPGAKLIEKLEALGISIPRGSRVAIAVGSRGINNLPVLVKSLIQWLAAQKAEPFIVSAMGSHGGGTPEGQCKILDSLGVSTETMGVPIICSQDIVHLGETPQGFPILFDRVAAEADLIIPINRIKAHTDFDGPIESGLCKMLVIGLGNDAGCRQIHNLAPEEYSSIIETAASFILSKMPVLFGVAILENGYGQSYDLDVLKPEGMIAKEKILLKKAKDLMPSIGIKEIDLLICEQIGKDISGAGFDPNILGRSSVKKTFSRPIPKIDKMVLLDLTEASHGNGIGIGMFDVVTRKAVDKLDFQVMYNNATACKCLEDVRIPYIAADESTAVEIAAQACRASLTELKIVRIKNTSELDYIQVSENLLDEVLQSDQMYIDQME